MTAVAGPADSIKPTPTPAVAIVAADLIRTGGMDRANLALADYLARQGAAVHAVAHRVDQELLKYANFTFHRVYKPLNADLLGAPFLDLVGRRLGTQIFSSGGLVLVNGGNCSFGDVNWVHYVHAACEPTVVPSFARQLKNTLAHRSFLAAEAKSLNAAKVVIANSNRTRKDLIDHLGIPAHKIHTVYYGNDPETFSPPAPQERTEIRRRLNWPTDRRIAIFIGALGDRRKGFDTLFAAWVEVCKSHAWDTDLVVVGRGAELPAWEKRAIEANMGSRIRYLGFRKDVPNLLRAADVLVAPTRYEAYGLGVQEALCCGTPAIVSADAGVAERYPEDLQSLLLPDCEDVADLVSRLLAWRSNMERLSQATRLLSDRMRLRSWDQMAREIVDIAEI